MKCFKITALILTLLVVGVFHVNAQWDDVYYDPDKDVIVENTNRYSSNDNYRRNQYQGDEYGYYDDYDFYYTSRIRRFHRPMYGFGFFDPVYVDALYYDPFMRPGMTVLIYDDFYSRRAWSYSRFNRFGFNTFGFNRFGFNGGVGFNRFGFSPFGYDPFSPFGFNSGFGFGFNQFGFSPFGGGLSALYCPPVWGNNNNYNNVTNYYSDTNSRGTAYTSRRGGSSIAPNGGVIPRRGTTTRNGRNIEPNTVDGKRPYPYSPAGANSLKPTTRNPNYTNSNERSRTRSTTAQPYNNPRNSRVGSGSSRNRNSTLTRPSSRTRINNSGSSRTRTRSVSPSTRTRSSNSSSRSRISTPSRSSSGVTRSSGSSSSRTRSSSTSSRKRGN